MQRRINHADYEFNTSIMPQEVEREMQSQANRLVNMSSEQIFSALCYFHSELLQIQKDITDYPAQGGSTLKDAMSTIETFFNASYDLYQSLSLYKKKKGKYLAAHESVALSKLAQSLINTINALYELRYPSFSFFERLDTQKSIDGFITMLTFLLDVFTAYTGVNVWRTCSFFNSMKKSYVVPHAISVNLGGNLAFQVGLEKILIAQLTLLMNPDVMKIVLDYLLASAEVPAPAPALALMPSAEMQNELKEEKNEMTVDVRQPTLSLAEYLLSVENFHERLLINRQMKFKQTTSPLQQRLFDLFVYEIRRCNDLESKPIALVYQQIQHEILQTPDPLLLKKILNDLNEEASNASDEFDEDALSELNRRMTTANQLFLDPEIRFIPVSVASSDASFFNAERTFVPDTSASPDQQEVCQSVSLPIVQGPKHG